MAMADTLYRKYRPQRFADLVNQQHVRLTLQQALQHDRVAHAYLFAGPRGVGKTTVARLLARALNCQRRGDDGEPCNTCATCTAMLANGALDVMEIDAASQTGVDNVRDNIIQSARTAPSMGTYKVFIIDEVHMLSLAAFNALLKLLEEPPARTIFILATTDVHRVPETVISRTQRFDFKKIPLGDMAQRLSSVARQEKRQVAPSVAERIARQAGGSLRDAESMLGQLLTFSQGVIDDELADMVLPRSDTQTIVSLIDALGRRQAVEALDVFHRFCDDGGDIGTFVHDLVIHVRYVMMLALDPSLLSEVSTEADQATTQTIVDLAGRIGPERATTMVETLLEAERQLSWASLEELPLEIAIVQLCLDQSQPPAASSASRSVAPTPVPSKPTSPVPPPTKTPSPSKPAAKKKTTTSQLPLADTQAAWAALQSSIGKSQPSLGLSVQHAQVIDVADGEVTVQAPFKLHVDRLSDPKFRVLLEQQLSQALGHDVTMKVLLGETVPDAPPPVVEVKDTPTPVTTGAAPKDLWDQVVTTFQST